MYFIKVSTMRMIYCYMYLKKFNLALANWIDRVYVCATFALLVSYFFNFHHGAIFFFLFCAGQLLRRII